MRGGMRVRFISSHSQSAGVWLEGGTLDLEASCRGVIYCLSRAHPSDGAI